MSPVRFVEFTPPEASINVGGSERTATKAVSMYVREQSREILGQAELNFGDPGLIFRPAKAKKKTPPEKLVYEVVSPYNFTTHPTKLETSWYVLAGRDEENLRMYGLYETGAYDFGKDLARMTSLGEDTVSWFRDSIEGEQTTFVDVLSKRRISLPGKQKCVHIYRKGKDCFLMLRNESSDQNSRPTELYRWCEGGLVKLENLAFSALLTMAPVTVENESFPDSKKGTIGSNAVNCHIGMAAFTPNGALYEGVTEDGIVYQVTKGQQGGWYGKRKTQIGQGALDFSGVEL